MTEKLPITINIDHEIVTRFSKIQSVCNKLEAQFNFQTMTANWYGDEENILFIQLALKTPSSFTAKYEGVLVTKNTGLSITEFSDDVVCLVDETALQLDCLIALTEAELELLDNQAKLLVGLIQAKLHKVLNLIAKQQSLSEI